MVHGTVGLTYLANLAACLSLSAFIVQGAEVLNRDDYAHELDPNFWHDHAHQKLQSILRAKQEGVAKNIILFVGDGMGVTSVTGARIWAGQQNGLNGEENELSWDMFPFTGLSKTYDIDYQTTGSAAAGTALLCGVKTRTAMLGLSGQAKPSQCSSVEGNEVESILNWAMAAGKSGGLVSNMRVTHASPAAAYAKCPNRYWESDRKIPESEKNCTDIAFQLIKQNPRIQVILGGGRANFLPEGVADPDPDPHYDADDHSRTDGLNLIEEWKKEKRNRSVSHRFVYNRTGLDDVNPATTDYLLGLFNQGHMHYELHRDDTKEPSLAEMTEKAIRILSKNDNGYFLYVEGGLIDLAHHINMAEMAFAETTALNRAVQLAKDITSDEDTLIVVTADHSHVMALAGYAGRGNPITGLSKTKEGTLNEDLDGLPYTTVVYGNGPGYQRTRRGSRYYLTDDDVESSTYRSEAAIPMYSSTHGAEDVAIYATGPQAFLYTGTHEQSYIPMAMAYASCIGPYAEGRKACAKRPKQQPIQPTKPAPVSLPQQSPYSIEFLMNGKIQSKHSQ